MYGLSSSGKARRNGAWALAWNGENQLIEASKPGTTVTFKYDPFGRRIEKAVTDLTGTTTRTYLYDEEDIVFELVDNGVATTKNHFVHGPGIDEPLALVRGEQSYFYHADGLGSIAVITDTAQNIVQSYSYEAFGLTTASGTFEQPYGFTGREFDAETGLYFYRARYYDPAEGRFLGVDPLIFGAGDANLFRYVGNNTPNLIDPSGKNPVLLYFGAKALAVTIPWATMKAVSFFMDDPRISCTTEDYRMSDLADDLAATTAMVNVATAPLVAAPMAGGAGAAALAKAAPPVYYASMAAAGTPQGQTWLSRFLDAANGAWSTPSQPKTYLEALPLFNSLYGDWEAQQ